MNAEQIARALGGKRSGNQWKCKCPAHNDTDPSMIVFDGKRAVQVRCYSGCAPLDIIAALRERGLWDASSEDLEPENERPHPSLNRHLELAMRIWDGARDAPGTLADLYLRGRNLALPKDSSEVIRFHPECPRGQERMPALVVLMRNVRTFAPQAVQRIFLSSARCSPITKVDAMMLGSVAEAAMMLTSRHDTFWADLSTCPRLCVCEGLETGLSVYTWGDPVWALGSAGAISRFPVLEDVSELLICADNDRAGIGAAIDCADRWNAAQFRPRVRVITPEEPGTDFADRVRHG